MSSVVILISRVIVGAHLNPLGFELCSIPSPLPPLAATDSVDACVAELFDQEICSLCDLSQRYWDRVHLDPSRMWHPLRCECLQLLDRMVSRMVEERTDEVNSFVIRDMCRWFMTAWLAVRVLGLYVSGTSRYFV